MPARSRDVLACFKAYQRHVGELTTKILDCFVQLDVVESAPGKALLMLPNNQQNKNLPGSVRLKTRVGTLHLFFWELLRIAPSDNGESRCQVTIANYSYTLKESAVDGRQYAALPPLVRWSRMPPEAGQPTAPPRLYLESTIRGPDQSMVNLGRRGVPTGAVPVEELLRCLVTEFDVYPACGNQWQALLAAARQRYSVSSLGRVFTAP